MIHVMDQMLLGQQSSFTRSTLWTARFYFGLFHFQGCWSLRRYSLFQHVQNRFARYMYCTHRQHCLIKTSAHLKTPGGGSKMLVFIVRRLLGLNGSRSSGSLEVNVNGLEFIIASTSQSRVLQGLSSRLEPCSCSKQWVPCKWCKFAALISQPCDCHSVDWKSSPYLLGTTCSQFAHYPSRQLLVVLLSLHLQNLFLCHLESLGGPWQAIKPLRAWINESVSREVAVSICTALLAKHVKRHPYR